MYGNDGATRSREGSTLGLPAPMIPRSIIFVITIFFLTISTSIPVLHAASGDVGEAAGDFLRINPGARGSAMGSALVAGYADPYSVQTNPALLGLANSGAASATHQKIFQDVNYDNAALVAPLGKSYGSLGFSVKSVDFGEQDRTQVDPTSSTSLRPILNLGTFSSSNMAAGVGWGKSWTRSLSTGLNVNYVKQSIAGFSDNTLAADFGAHYRIEEYNLAFGFAGRNFIGNLQLNRASDPLPRIYEIGFYQRYQLNDTVRTDLGFTFAQPEHSVSYVSTGLELAFWESLFLRAGYSGDQNLDSGLTLGGGVRIDQFRFDYAMEEFGDLGRQRKLSISYVF